MADMTHEPLLERVLHDAERIFTRHRATIDPSNAPEENPVSLTTIEASIRNSVENAAEWLHQAVDTHLPAAEAELQRIQASPVVQALEAVVLTPAEEAMISKIIAELPSLRLTASAESGSPATDTPGDPGIPDPSPQPASGQPAVSGAAT